MTKRAVLFLLLWLASRLGATAQINCSNSTNLVCLAPFATRTQEVTAAFNASFAAQLTQLPLPSSPTGVVFVFDKSINEDVPLENLGPILTDRPQIIGKKKLFLGFSFQQFTFNSINGITLAALPSVSVSNAGPVTQYIVQTAHVSFKLDEYVVVGSYGLTDRTDVSVVVPIERVSIDAAVQGTQYFVNNATNPPTPIGMAPFSGFHASGLAVGIGDLLFNVKHEFVKGERFHFASGLLLRLPTGDALNYLGSGAYGFTPYAVVSYQWRISPHARLGYVWNTSTVLIQPPPVGSPNTSTRLPGGFQYNFGADMKAFQRVTVAVDLLGNQFQNSPVLIATPFTIPGFPADSPQTGIVRQNASYISNDFSIGLKWKPLDKRNLLVYANGLFQLNNVGLRSDPVPLLGLSYTFKP
jgi:hypothetical protein